MLSEKEIILAFIQLAPIIIIWVRLESRLSRLEGRFDMLVCLIQKTLDSIEKRHGI